MTQAGASGQSTRSADDTIAAPETELWRKWAAERSPNAREAVFAHYLPYARAIAARLYAGRHRDDVEFRDFVQLACIGLLESIDRFDPARGVTFETFCTTRVRGEILTGVEKLTDGQEQISFSRRVRRERVASLQADGDRAARQGRDALQALGTLAAGLAIGFMLDGTGLIVPPADGVPSDDPALPGAAYHGIAWRQTKTRLAAAVLHLPERTRKIIQYHYFHGLAFEQIADILGVSKGRISQLHRAALTELRERLGEAEHMHLIG
ncbi:TPA: sigma-70 family RNA polymerase sigma factor [Burkholderia cenocepacia]|uniref:sigma-70 family RNA polymerase sigma factor n=1 Tax=unclassified Burkholderia TaxID=2613784 RepID=UPI00158A85B6|nr:MULTISPECIES: sigma-70 family RNA polymerase sigma factor [unclassified Burkholderia]HEF5875104.1 sigma-70 family RNA polymerase sigma factor [Burkholderia cenocepacia]